MSNSAHQGRLGVGNVLTGGVMRVDDLRRYQLAVGATVVVLILIRLVVAAKVPLAFDEALYWRWSQHLAGGYLDHPPMNPLLIRLGTALFGNNEFGVRVMSVLLGLPATWAVWRAGTILFKDAKVGATAALFFNLTLAMAVGSVLSTPDSPVMVTTCFLLLALAKLNETGRGAWWLAIGVAFGLGMFSKYSTLFFAPSILIWLIAVPEQRKWLRSFWPWVSGLIALAIFSPVLIWNAGHDWASVFYQSQRLVVHRWTLRYLGEFYLGQFGLAIPQIFLLGCMGLYGMLRLRSEPQGARVLLGAMVWPIVLYFTWHTLHGRVQGNWPEPMYPAFVICAAAAAERFPWRGSAAWWALWSKRFAVPVGLGFALVIYAQAMFAVVPLGAIDPTARAIGAGWPALAKEIDALRIKAGAGIVLADNYRLAGWLPFYLPSHPPVEQINGRMRWVNEPAPDAKLFKGPMLFVCLGSCDGELAAAFGSVERLATLPRQRRGVTIAPYSIYRVAAPRGPVLQSPTLQSP
jgi:4-amino-4-deoxy-L-arabinose transferase-like glycosyltransferase